MPPFQRRVGYKDFTRWRGINKQGSASNIGLNELRDGINIDFSGGQIISRGGQSKLDGGTLTGCVFGIHDQVSGPYGVKIYMHGEVVGSGTNALLSYSAEDSPAIQALTQSAAGFGGPNNGIVSYEDTLHYVAASKLAKIVPIELLPGESAATISGLLRGVDLVTVQSAAGAIRSIAVMRPTLNAEESIFIGSTALGDLIVKSWDGTSLRSDSSALPAGDQVLATYREDLFVFGTHYAKQRAGGTYSAISMPGGLTSFRPRDAATYKDKLYICGYDRTSASSFISTILSFDGTTLAVANQPASVGTVGESSEGVMALTVGFGFLFYGWRDPAIGSGKGFVGRFDGSSWVDAHKDLWAQFANATVRSLLYANESLFALVTEISAASAKLVQSPGSSTSGTWVDRGSLDDGTDLFTA